MTVWVPDTTDSVVIAAANSPGLSSARGPIVSPLPGSGTYRMIITLKWHTELAACTTYAVALYVPRQP